MALVVITVQDTENGAVVSLASEPLMNMSAPPAGKAQELAHLMLAALPMNPPTEEAAPAAAQEEGTSADAEVQFPM
jgi:hypothetical protein